MRRSTRWRILGGSVVSTLATACSALLNIHDISAPDLAEAGGTDGGVADGSVASDAPSDAGTGVIDAADGSLPSCAMGGDPCIVVVQPDGGLSYPTWQINSEVVVYASNTARINPILPVYQDAGTGVVADTITHLAWQTAIADGGPVPYLDATAYCHGLGAGWRIPTLVESISTEYRTNPDGGQTWCAPPPFDQGGSVVWTSTPVPVAQSKVYMHYQSSCGFEARLLVDVTWVRCVKGDAKPATFVVSVSADTVWSVETSLEWERTGVVVKTPQEAKTHCDNLPPSPGSALSWRLPTIKEAYAILDPRTSRMFDQRMFALPDGGAAPSKFLSQTSEEPSPMHTANYHAVDLSTSPGVATGVEIDSENVADVLIRCVHPRM